MPDFGKTTTTGSGTPSLGATSVLWSELDAMPEGGTLDSVSLYFTGPVSGSISAAVYKATTTQDIDGAVLIADLGAKAVTGSGWETWTASSETITSGDEILIGFKSDDGFSAVLRDESGAAEDANAIWFDNESNQSNDETVAWVTPHSTTETSRFTSSLAAYITYTAASSDTTAPTVSSASVTAAGDTIAVQMSESVAIGAGGAVGWTCSLDGVTVTAAVDGVDDTIVNLTPSRTILSGESLTVGYTQPGDGVEDAAGNDLVTFSGQAVTNNSTQVAIDDPGTITFTIGTPGEVDLTSTGWTDQTWGVEP